MRFLLLCGAVCGFALAQDWPAFRGPSGQGHSSETDLPTEWSEEKNVIWKVPVAGRGWSSPAIAGDLIWLTTAVEPGGAPESPTRSLRLLAFRKDTGAPVHDLEIFKLEDAGKQHAKNSFASPTPLVEGDRVYVHFGRLGTAAVTTAGEILWKRSLPYAYAHGTGGSPVVHKNLLIMTCDGTDVQYTIALDKETGEVEWKVHRRRPAAMAFSTPLVIDVNGSAQAITTSGRRAVAYEAETGRELWQVTYGDGFSNVPRPVFAHGLVYLCTGFYQPHLLAVRPDGSGDVTGTHIAWRFTRAVPLTPSPIIVGDLLYMVSDNGILTCLDAKTGEQRFQQRLGGNFSASPVFAAGKLYFQSEEGETTVIAPEGEFRQIGSAKVESQTLASLAPSSGSIFLRSATHLYRIGVR